MLVTSVVIVLREVLEAALLISVLLALSRRLPSATRWLLAAIAVGVLGGFVYAHFLGTVSEMFEGTGQELVNALLQFLVFAAAALIVFFVARARGRPSVPNVALPALMALAVAISSIREGSEIVVYVSGFLAAGHFVSSVGIGSLAGAGIGFSVGVLFYYVLLAMPERRSLWVSVVLLSLAASGMCAQAVQLLVQADWLSTAGPAWDTSWLVPEGSLPGQLLYALVGYEAAPSTVVAVSYGVSLAVFTAAIAIGWATYVERSAE
ncbi:MAG: FTR1 family protein [Woeseiaceae bacterium]